MRARVLLPVAGVLGLLVSGAYGFSAPAAAVRPSRCLTALRVVNKPLDPMQLIQDKDMQQCALRPYKSKEENNGLATATFALGHPEAALGAPSGVKVTRVGYCGGSTANPTYRKVCSDPAFSDWAECVQVDFKEDEVPYEDLCRLFFKSHEPSMGSSKRQYMSAIFAHTDEQFETASRVLHAVKESKTRVSTAVEMATDFYEAEYYHQKWLLQRKADWFKRLDMEDPRELIEGEAPSRLNAYVAGYVKHDEMKAFAQEWVKTGAVSQDTFERVNFYL